MSYCRWSSDNWKCDLYCYAHVDGGYMTHVAGCRHKNVPELPAYGSASNSEHWEAYKKQMEFLDTAEIEDIGLEYDGSSFNDPDLESFLGRVLLLKKEGYHVPDYVIERIKEEMEDEK